MVIIGTGMVWKGYKVRAVAEEEMRRFERRKIENEHELADIRRLKTDKTSRAGSDVARPGRARHRMWRVLRQ
jgi:predicted phage gp36 major capsid-like protein